MNLYHTAPSNRLLTDLESMAVMVHFVCCYLLLYFVFTSIDLLYTFD